MREEGPRRLSRGRAEGAGSGGGGGSGKGAEYGARDGRADKVTGVVDVERNETVKIVLVGLCNRGC